MGLEESENLVSQAFRRFPNVGDSCLCSQTSLNGDDEERDIYDRSHSVESIEKTTKYLYSCRLLHEFTVQIYRVGRCHSVLGKIFSSSLFRKWHKVRLLLTDNDIRPKFCTGLNGFPISFSSMKNSKVVPFIDSFQNHLIKIPVNDGFVIIKTFDAHNLNQFLYSLSWKRRAWSFQQALLTDTSLQSWSQEIKDMVNFSLNSPILDPIVRQHPFNVATKIFLSKYNSDQKLGASAVELASHFLVSLQKSFPLSPSHEILKFFATFPEESFSDDRTREMFFDVIEWVLKHNMDFKMNPLNRSLVQSFVDCAWRRRPSNDDLVDFINYFVIRMHGSSGHCPHLRILHNLFSISSEVITRHLSLNTNNNSSSRNLLDFTRLISPSTSSLSSLSSLPMLSINDEGEHFSHQHHFHDLLIDDDDDDNDGGGGDTSGNVNDVEPYFSILLCLSTFFDWRMEMSSLMQSIPFPIQAFSERAFISNIRAVLLNLIGDERCSVHQSVLGSRPWKPGWFELCAVGGVACDEEEELHNQMLDVLIGCCCYRKKFFKSRKSLVDCWLKLARRNKLPAIKALCGCLEFNVFSGEEKESNQKDKIVAVLESTEEGRLALDQIYRDKIKHQSTGSGLRKLSLPSKSTDLDLKTMLSSGCYGDLETLSLAFTKCTGSCADDIINLPSLKELNLWSTQFDDSGLQLICDHLHDLQILNLCETLVTSQGILCLASLKKLKKLNLNSTNVSLTDFEKLKELLPTLEEVDIRYTDAWMDVVFMNSIK